MGAEVVALLVGHENGATRIDLKRRTVSDVAGQAVGISEKWAHLAPRLDGGPSVSLLKLKDVEYRLNVLEKPTGNLTNSRYIADLEAHLAGGGQVEDSVQSRENRRRFQCS